MFDYQMVNGNKWNIGIVANQAPAKKSRVEAVKPPNQIEEYPRDLYKAHIYEALWSKGPDISACGLWSV